MFDLATFDITSFEAGADPAAARVVETLVEIFCPPDMRNSHDQPSNPPGAR